MGAVTAAFIFDYRRYVSCVAPPLRRVLRSGSLGPWLEAFWRVSRGERTGRPVETYPNPPMPPNPTLISLRADLSTADGLTDLQLIRETAEPLQYDLLQWLLQTFCLGEWVWLGNARYAETLFGYELADEGFTVPARLEELVGLLSRDVRTWAHGSGGYSEGVHGWWTPSEAAEAAALFESVALPEPPRSLALVNDWSRTQRDSPPDGYVGSALGWEDRVFAAKLRAVAQTAADSGHGLLWGNDCDGTPLCPWTPPDLTRLGRTVDDLAAGMMARRQGVAEPQLQA
jgi:hypothetical protein